MTSVPRLTERYPRRVELVFQNSPDASALRVGAADTLDNAATGTTAMFDVQNPGTFRSPFIRHQRWGITQHNNRGISRALYNPEDYWAAAANMPHDGDISFLRVTEIDHTGAAKAEGPVLVVPPPGFFSTPRPVLTLQGTAPNVAATATGLPPSGSLHVYLPRFFDYATITNTDGAGNSMWISFDRGLPEIEIGAGKTREFLNAADNEFLVRSTLGGGLSFEMGLSIVNGLSV